MLAIFKRLYGPVVRHDTVPAAPSVVYETLSDPSTYPDWLVGAHHIRAIDPAFPRPGSEFEHTVGLADPLNIDDTTEAVGAVEDHRLSLVVNVSFFHARVDFELFSRENGDTTIRFSEKPTGLAAIVTPLLRPMLGRRNEESLRRLRHRFAELTTR